MQQRSKVALTISQRDERAVIKPPRTLAEKEGALLNRGWVKVRTSNRATYWAHPEWPASMTPLDNGPMIRLPLGMSTSAAWSAELTLKRLRAKKFTE